MVLIYVSLKVTNLRNHPTFALVLYNYKVRNQLHKLGNIFLNTEYKNLNVDFQELQNVWKNNDDRKKLQ